MSISTREKVHLWIYLLNHNSWSHQSWSIGRALVHVMLCIMHVITFGRPLVHVILSIMHVISFGRALVHVVSCIMWVITFERPLVHVITFGRALVHDISCIMHVMTVGTALVHVISCVMHVEKYCVMSLLNHWKKLKNELLNKIKNRLMVIFTSMVYTLFKNKLVSSSLKFSSVEW